MVIDLLLQVLGDVAAALNRLKQLSTTSAPIRRSCLNLAAFTAVTAEARAAAADDDALTEEEKARKNCRQDFTRLARAGRCCSRASRKGRRAVRSLPTWCRASAHAADCRPPTGRHSLRRRSGARGRGGIPLERSPEMWRWRWGFAPNSGPLPRPPARHRPTRPSSPTCRACRGEARSEAETCAGNGRPPDPLRAGPGRNFPDGSSLTGPRRRVVAEARAVDRDALDDRRQPRRR
jgi:hypothetical protein